MSKQIIEAEVKSNIGLVAKDTENAAEQMSKFGKETENTGKAAKKSSGSFKKLSTAAKGFGTALKAAGIGLIIAGFVALKEALERNQKFLDTMDTVVGTISKTFNDLASTLADVVVWVTASSDRFNGLGAVVKGITTLALSPLKLSFFAIKLAIDQTMLAWENSFLGNGDKAKMTELRKSIALTKSDLKEVRDEALEAGKNVISNFGDAVTEIGAIYEKVAEGVSKISIKSNYELAEATTASIKAAKFAQAEFAKLNAQKLKEAEDQRQIRDDETKTFAERIEANEKLQKILEEQQTLQREQIQKQIRSAELAVQQNGNDENKLALMEAQNAELELEEAINGQLSEQKTNQVSLEKELLQVKNELAAEGLSGIERELLELENAYEEKKKMAKKSGMTITEIEKQYNKQKAALIRANVATQLDAYANLAGALKTLAGENKQLAIAEAIIATWSAATKALDAPAPLNFINMASVLAAGFANVQKIMQTDVGSGGGGSVPSGSLSTPAPEMLSGKFELGNVQEQQPVQAYVVTDNLTDNQNKLAYIRRRATI